MMMIDVFRSVHKRRLSGVVKRSEDPTSSSLLARYHSLDPKQYPKFPEEAKELDKEVRKIVKEKEESVRNPNFEKAGEFARRRNGSQGADLGTCRERKIDEQSRD